MRNKINLEAELAYKKIRDGKNKFGSYCKTLFHVDCLKNGKTYQRMIGLI